MSNRNRKIGKCQNCCPDGGAIFLAEMDYGDTEMQPVWVCQNCHTKTPRRIQGRAGENSPLTPSQIIAITRIQQNQLRSAEHEVKALRITNLGHCASVVVIVGRKGDEGTLAESLCRRRGHFVIGRKGAIEAVDATDKAKAKRNPLIYGWIS